MPQRDERGWRERGGREGAAGPLLRGFGASGGTSLYMYIIYAPARRAGVGGARKARGCRRPFAARLWNLSRYLLAPAPPRFVPISNKPELRKSENPKQACHASDVQCSYSVAASERTGNNFQGVEGFYLKAKARIWRSLPYMCREAAAARFVPSVTNQSLGVSADPFHMFVRVPAISAPICTEFH